MITTRMQVQAITDRLARISTPFSLDDFTGIYRLAWQAMDNCQPGKEVEAIVALPFNQEERATLRTQIEHSLPGAGYHSLPTAAELEPTVAPIEFLWDGWIPRGMLSMLAASPGTGKSLLALDLCRRVINAEPFYDGAGCFRPGMRAIYVDAENSPQILFERLRAWDLDMKRLFIKQPGDCGYIDLDNPLHKDLFIEEVYTTRPDLVVIDAFANITTRSENYVEEMRGLLQFLSDLAQDYNLAMLIIHHLRKAGFRGRGWYMSIDDIRGSGSIIAMTRSVMGMSLVQEGEGIDLSSPRRLAVIKTNVAPPQPALGFELEAVEPRGVNLKWVSAPQPNKELLQVDLCARWLVRFMQDSEVSLHKPKDVVAFGLTEGFSERTVYRAKSRLVPGNNIAAGYITSTGGRKNPHGHWTWVPSS